MITASVINKGKISIPTEHPQQLCGGTGGGEVCKHILVFSLAQAEQLIIFRINRPKPKYW